MGLRWEPDERTSAEARYGDRFFRLHVLSSNARRTARTFEFAASYSESPEVQTQILSLGSFTPGELPPGIPGNDVGRFNSTPYVGKNASVGVAAIGSRTRISLTGYQNVQDYIRQAQSDDTTTGSTFAVTRQLASNLSADFSASYSRLRAEPGRRGWSPSVTVTTNSYDTTSDRAPESVRRPGTS